MRTLAGALLAVTCMFHAAHAAATGLAAPSAGACRHGSDRDHGPVIHQSTAADGSRVFTDRPAAGGGAQVSRPAADAAVRVTGTTDPALAEAAQVQARAVAGILARTLDLGRNGTPAPVEIHLVADAEALAQATGIADPAIVGAYSYADGRVHVRTDVPRAALLGTLRHEVVHALLHRLVGRLPPALDEGLATLLEGLVVQGLGGTVRIPDLSALPGPAPTTDRLRALLEADRRTFQALPPESAYPDALALAAVLLERSAWRERLAALLREQRASPCTPVAAANRLLSDGSADDLVADWLAVRNGERAVNLVF